MTASPTLTEIAEHLRAFFAAHGDPALVAKYSRYFKEGYDAYGVPQEIQFAERDRLMETVVPQIGLAGVLDLGDILFRSGKYEEGSMAYLLAKELAREFTPDSFQRLGRWLENGVCNWAHTDVICGELLSRHFDRGVATMPDLAAWRQSPSRWKRRAVPVALLTPLKKAQDVGPMLEFLRPMMLDGERVVHQGLGWFLREAWKKHPQPVEAFLLEYKDTVARLIFQYATEKMDAAGRTRFRKTGGKSAKS
jgi:3-methyladenine DNA glycosylase AlkD